MAHYDTVDITDLKETGNALKAAIIQAVKDTQLFIVRPYPHILLVTPQQFEELKPNEDSKPWDDFLYLTPLNAMDVRVKGINETRNKLDNIVLS